MSAARYKLHRRNRLTKRPEPGCRSIRNSVPLRILGQHRSISGSKMRNLRDAEEDKK
jgi:hypothetical protein